MDQQRMRNGWNFEQIEIKKVLFQKMDYSIFWVYLLKFPEYEKLAQTAIAILIEMPTTYFCEESFSNLMEIKSKKKKHNT